MTQQFTASEVREAAEDYRAGGAYERAADMLTAYADLLEAQEKAVPVATVEDQLGFPIMEWIGDAGDKCPVGTKLYTHSDPSDAGRLAEALRAIRQRVTENSSALARFIIATCDEALAAHSAQAQPPAASVPTLRYFIGGPKAFAYVDKPEHVEAIITALCECTGDDSEDYTATDLSAAHSAQAQPPAASVPDSNARDAARYQWLRVHYDVSASRHGVNDLLAIRLPQQAFPHTGTIMDSFVDNAMLAAQENPNG